ncbi:MAG: ABC transporter permease [Eubacteriaceae bacterium]|nr:ABC transporter permease [Eubacteriaceae bacterium]
MIAKMIKKDIRQNKAIAITLCLFITLASMLVAGAFAVIAEMAGAMDDFFEAAKPLHYMQMVTGVLDQKAIDDYSAKHEMVVAQQTLELLGIDNNCIYYGDNPEPYSDSVMENSFVTQSSNFDFLLDENNSIVSVKPGEIAMPLYAIDAYNLAAGDTVTVKNGNFVMHFVVVCFIRDSQMNASLVSSKRFLISGEDYVMLKENIGEVEYLIEFLLADPAKTGEFESDYLAAGLPSGIAITFSIIQLMNAMTGGLSVVVLLLAGVFLIVIAAMCLRFTILAALEEEYREIGVMKAIGFSPKMIKKIYKYKYYSLSAVSSFAGFMLSMLFSSSFTKIISQYMGRPATSIWSFVMPLSGSLIVFLVMALYCSLVLRELRKVSIVDAIRGTDAVVKPGSKSFPIHRNGLGNINISLGMRDVINRLGNYKTPIFIFTLCVFLIIVPINFLNTLQSPDFIGYTGIGKCDAVITLRNSENMPWRYSSLIDMLSADKDVLAYAGRITANYKVLNLDGKYENISIQNGDYTTFPIPYLQGGAPATGNEIALSFLNARNYEKGVGDSIEIYINGKPRKLMVCGIYQDLTNGGKSAQACLPYNHGDVLWYAVSLDFEKTVDAVSKIASYNEQFAPAKVVGIETFASQTLASTIQQFGTVTLIVSMISIAVAVLVTALFLKMILAKDRSQITIMKGLGFNSSHIQSQYIAAFVFCLVLGLVLGVVGANTFGEMLIGALMSGIGASKISFIIKPVISFVACPLLLMLAVVITVLVSARSIHKCGSYIITE